MCLTNKSFMTKLFLICNFFIILPPINENGKQLLRIFRFCCGLYVLLATALFVWMNVFSSYVDERIDPILATLHKISKTGVYISSCTMVLKMAVFKMALYQKFLANLWKMNEMLLFRWMKSTNLSYMFFTYFSCVFATVIKDYYDICALAGCMMMLPYLLELFQSMQNLLLTIAAISLVDCIKHQYVAVINKLLKYARMYTSWNGRNRRNAFIQLEMNTENVKDIIRLHEEICDLVDSFNAVFGSSILLAVFSATLPILIYATGFAKNYLSEMDGQFQEVDMGTLILRFITAALLIILQIFLAHKCSSAAAEGKRLVATSLSFSNQLSMEPRTYDIEVLQRSLLILYHQAETRMPEFTAGGFFTVDYTMLRMLVGSLITNMVIVLQFMQGNRKLTCSVNTIDN